jgi:hypothetical protein
MVEQLRTACPVCDDILTFMEDDDVTVCDSCDNFIDIIVEDDGSIIATIGRY